jgi:hypothetical protein
LKKLQQSQSNFLFFIFVKPFRQVKKHKGDVMMTDEIWDGELLSSGKGIKHQATAEEKKEKKEEVNRILREAEQNPPRESIFD